MAEHPNAALLRNGYEAFNKGDMATLREVFSEDTVWHVPGNNLLSGEHRSRDAVFALFARIAELSGGTYRTELHDALANDEHAVGLARATGSRQGKQLDSRDVAIYHVRNERITEAWSFAEDQRVTDEFWS
jgi:hypothetical protein